MQNFAEGKDMNGLPLWHVRETETPALDQPKFWDGTGRDQLFQRFMSLEMALDYYIAAYPGTQLITIVIENRFTPINLAEAARASMINHIMERVNSDANTD